MLLVLFSIWNFLAYVLWPKSYVIDHILIVVNAQIENT